MTHASSAVELLPAVVSTTFTHSPIVPATTTALPAAWRPVSRSGGQSKTLPHSNDAQTSIRVGQGSAGSAAAAERGPGDRRAATVGDVVADDLRCRPRRRRDAPSPMGSGEAVGVAAVSAGRRSRWSAATVALGRSLPLAERPDDDRQPTTTSPVAARIRRLRRRLSGVGSIRNSTRY